MSETRGKSRLSFTRELKEKRDEHDISSTLAFVTEPTFPDQDGICRKIYQVDNLCEFVEVTEDDAWRGAVPVD